MRVASSPMFAHITPLEMPVVWVAFALGLVLGGTLVALWKKRAEAPRN